MPHTPSRVHDFFQGVNTPSRSFDFNDEAGAPFRQLLAQLPPSTAAVSALTSALSAEKIMDAIHRAQVASSPGIDGINYDIFKKLLH